MSSATNIPISATTTDFKSAIKAAEAAISSFDRTLNKELVDAFRAADRANKDFQSGLGRIEKIMAQQAAAANKSIESIGSKFKAVGQALSTYITLPLLAIGATAFKTYADIDALQKGLNQVSGSAAAGAVEFEKLREVAKLPGIGLAEAVQGSVRLQAVGFSADNARKAITAFGKAIALTGGGKAELNSVTVQLGQMAAKGKVVAQDLKPILEAAPVAGNIIQRIFGSRDPEEISAKLKAAGKDSAFFIDLLTTELNKVAGVIGGPKNAIENLGDSLKISAFEFFKVADASLGLTDKLNAVGSFVSGLATSFAKLSPGAQTAILAFTGLAAAAGPVVIAIGGIIALIPALTAGAATLTAALGIGLGPIALIAAAVAGAAVIIIANWDSIKKVLTDSGIWQSVAGVVTSAFDTIKSIFQLATGVISTYWDHFGGSLGVIAQAAFHAVAVVFNTGAGIIRGIFQTLGGILNLDWRQALGGLATIGKTIVAALVGLFQVAFESIGGTIAYLFNLIGADGVAKSVIGATKQGANALQGLQNKLRGVGDEAKKTAIAVAGIGGAKKATTGSTTASTAPNFLANSASGIQELKDAQKAAKEAVESFKALNPGKAVPAELLDRYKDLTAQLKAATSATTKQREENEKSMSVLQALQLAQKLVNDEIAQKRAFGLTVPPKLLSELSRIEAQIRKIKGLSDDIKPLKPKGDDVIRQNYAGEQDRRDTFVGALNTTQLPGLDAALTRLTAPFKKVKDALSQFNEDIQSSLKQAATGALIGMGEVIGGLIAGTNGISALPQVLLGALGGLLKQLGQIAIEAAVGLLAIKKAFETLNPAVALVAGIGLIALGSVVQSGASKIGGNIKGYAKGGVFDTETVGRFGEYAGASLNREIATPERLMGSVFRSELENYGMNRKGANTPQVIRLDINGMLKGADIHLSQQRYVTISGDYNG